MLIRSLLRNRNRAASGGGTDAKCGRRRACWNRDRPAGDRGRGQDRSAVRTTRSATNRRRRILATAATSIRAPARRNHRKTYDSCQSVTTTLEAHTPPLVLAQLTFTP